MTKMNPCARLDRLLHRNVRNGELWRGTRTVELLCSAVAAMEKHQQRLAIPDRYITVMRYLADHPTALIIPDANVTKAFQYAKQAFSMQ